MIRGAKTNLIFGDTAHSDEDDEGVPCDRDNAAQAAERRQGFERALQERRQARAEKEAIRATLEMQRWEKAVFFSVFNGNTRHIQFFVVGAASFLQSDFRGEYSPQEMLKHN